MSEQKILITEIERCALHDGPGIRSVVFFKGCPLRCFWCCNPETQQRKKELLRSAKDCVCCGACVSVCEIGCAARSEDGNIYFFRDNCRACGACAEACPAGALRIAGEEADIETIVRRVLKDRDYYEASGGGVTLSGGEPFFQAEGALALLAALKDEKLHTAVETTGAVSEEVLQRAVPLTDLFLFDLKHSDPARFREGCGGDLPLIISNLKSLVGAGADVLVRTPVIPGFNDDPKVLEGIFKIALNAGVKSVRLLPYHALGRDKYKKLGREYPPGDMPMTDKKELEPLLGIGRNMGLDAAMGD